MTELLLKRELEPAAQQQRRIVLLSRLSAWWLLLAAAAVVIAVAEIHFPLPAVLLLLTLGIAGAIGAFAFTSSKFHIDYRKLAQDIARQHPDLHTLLVTAVEQERDPASGRLGFLQEHVLNEALVGIRSQQQLHAVPEGVRRRGQLFHAFALLLFFAALCGMPRQGHPRTGVFAQIVAGRDGVTVAPGDTQIERGNGLVVLATFSGAVPAEATLVVTGESGQRRIPLSRNLKDPVFGGSIPEVTAPFRYRVEYPGDQTPDYSVTVFEFPRLERADAAVTYPDYTGMQKKEIPDTRRITAVQGSTVELNLQLNKEVTAARLVGHDKTELPLAVEKNTAQAHLPAYTLESSQRYDLRLVDAEGRTNKMFVEFAFDVLTNQRPQLKLLFPRADQRVSALQEMFFQGEAMDDFGLRGWGLTYSIGGADTKTIVLGGTTPAHEKTNFVHVLRLEDLGVQPDQLVSYYLWADDFGPDGRLRRTSGDMFFSEVRPFEEIFREGEGNESQSQQQRQQQGQGQSPATKLADLEKQIINATWKLLRNEAGQKPSPQYLKDEPVVRDSQASALEQVDAVEENLTEIKMKEHAQTAARQMTLALDRLNEATNSTASLPKALAAEQAAYQALLKLQSRQFQVVQMRNQSRGSQSQSQRNQAQVNQLELKKQRNSYETQREAEQQQPPARKEQLEVLNRLKELAQRQQDINQRLKELQTELQAARTPERREELQRELKRLRDEQRDMLADMDELRQKMEQPENSSQMAESRQQLDQARQDAQRAAQALDQQSQQSVPQALTSGTRAERQLEQIRDDIRKSASSQFANEMRQMRNDARDLAEKEQDIQKQMRDAGDRPRALSDNGEAQEIARKFGEQKQGVTNLLVEMKQVTDQAEVAEPLLSRQLYDALRRSSQGTLDQSLTAAQELTSHNFLREAQPFEQRASTDIGALTRDVEKAAESVLGDESEALRSAKRELDRLAQQLQSELARAATTNSALSNAMAGATRGTERGTRDPAGTNALASSAARIGNRNGDSNSLAAVSRSNATNGLAAGGSRSGSTNFFAAAGAASTNQAGGATQARGGQNGRPMDETAAGAGQQQRGQIVQSGRPGRQGQPGQQGQGQQPGENGVQSEPAAESQPGQASDESPAQGQGGGGNNRGDRLAGIFDRSPEARQRNGAAGGGGGGDAWGPITGGDFTDWSQRLSNVEEMLDRPALRNQLAQARDRARALRAEFKRNHKVPEWGTVWKDIFKPITEVRQRVADELNRIESNDSLAPIDRDPVPGKYGELVRRYYENLGGTE